jgi:hypothetical protein
MISTFFAPEPLTYFGPELRPHFILSKWKIEDSALVAFRGPCDVKTDHLVDWEDRLANDSIRAKEMIHFLGEFFGATLKEGIWIQRLLVSEFSNELLKLSVPVLRDGDDLFIQGKKLSVSIVTASPVSVLLHLGINIDSEGAPVVATGLKNYLSPEKIGLLIQTILTRFESEFKSVHRASVKVRPVI